MTAPRRAAISLGREAEAVWDQLRAELTLQDGFWLAFLFGAQQHEVAEFMARTRDLARATVREVDEIRIASDGSLGPLLTARTGPSVTWLIDSFLGSADERGALWAAVLQRLNEQRDVLRRARPGGLIISCPPGALPMVRDTAPDLWSFRVLTGSFGLAPVVVEKSVRVPGGTDVSRHGLVIVPGPAEPASERIAPLLQRAALALGAKRTADAVRAAQAALDSAEGPGDDALAQAWLARAQAAQGERLEAERHAMIALNSGRSLGPEPAGALLDILAGSDNKDIARAAAEVLVERDRNEVVRLAESPTALHDLAVSLERLGDVQSSQHQLEPALTSYQMSLELFRVIRTVRGDSSDIATNLSISLNRVGEIQQTCGRFDEAYLSFSEGLQLARQVRDEVGDTEQSLGDLAYSLVRFGQIQRIRGRLDDAYRSSAESLLLARQVQGMVAEPLPAVPNALDQVGDIQLARGRLDDALSHYAEALQLRRDARAAQGDAVELLRSLSASLTNVAIVQQARGRLDDALTSLSEALLLDRRVRTTTGDTDESIGGLSVTLDHIGNIQKTRGQLDDALTTFTEALDLDRLRNGVVTVNTLHNTGVSLTKIGDIQQARGELDDAYSSYHEALQFAHEARALAGDTPQILRDVAYTLNKLGDIQRARGQFDDALAKHEQSLQLAREVHAITGDTPEALADMATSWEYIGDSDVALGRSPAAAAAYAEARALILRVRHDYGDSSDVLVGLRDASSKLAGVEAAGGRRERALELVRHALEIDAQLRDQFGPPFWKPTTAAELLATSGRLTGEAE